MTKNFMLKVSNFLIGYDRMTSCCLIFSLQAGVAIVTTLTIVWALLSIILNLIGTNNNPSTYKILQYVIAYSVLLLMIGGNLFMLIAISKVQVNMILVGFFINTFIIIIWFILSSLSYVNSTEINLNICIDGRCPDVLWLFDGRWRDIGYICPLENDDPEAVSFTRKSFSLAPFRAYGRKPYFDNFLVEQPGMFVPCYSDIPELVNAGEDGCKMRNWSGVYPTILYTEANFSRPSHPFINFKQLNKRSADDKDTKVDKVTNSSFDIFLESYDDPDEFENAFLRGCEPNRGYLILNSLGFCLFFSCFFLYSRTLEFDYYHELVMPFAAAVYEA